uniref:Transmembrane protein n=1 Tax=Pavo cristatus TaxID=9049 RepID=A0A8C9EP42_PAVCR
MGWITQQASFSFKTRWKKKLQSNLSLSPSPSFPLFLPYSFCSLFLPSSLFFLTLEILRKLYERIRLPVVPMYGWFPVKLRTFIGEPIPYDPDMTAEELTAKVR